MLKVYDEIGGYECFFASLDCEFALFRRKGAGAQACPSEEEVILPDRRVELARLFCRAPNDAAFFSSHSSPSSSELSAPSSLLECL